MSLQSCYKFHVACCGHRTWKLVREEPSDINTLLYKSCTTCPLEWLTVEPIPGVDEFTYSKYLTYLEKKNQYAAGG